jgi:hypothetical protein
VRDIRAESGYVNDAEVCRRIQCVGGGDENESPARVEEHEYTGQAEREEGEKNNKDGHLSVPEID